MLQNFLFGFLAKIVKSILYAWALIHHGKTVVRKELAEKGLARAKRAIEIDEEVRSLSPTDIDNRLRRNDGK